MKKNLLALAVILLLTNASSLSALTINDKYYGDIEGGIEFDIPLEKFFSDLDNMTFSPAKRECFQIGLGLNVNYFYKRLGINMGFNWGFSAKTPDKINNIPVEKACVNTFYFKLAPAFKIFDEKWFELKANAGIAFGTLSSTVKYSMYDIFYNTKEKTPFVFGLVSGAEFDFNITKMFYIYGGTDFYYMFTGDSKIIKKYEFTVDKTEDKIYHAGICFMPKIGFGARF